MWTAICACATFCLYFADLEADVLQTATGSKLVWPSIIEATQNHPDAYVSERTQYSKRSWTGQNQKWGLTRPCCNIHSLA